MTSTPARRPKVLFVGAYERDNFGDLLFLLVTEPFFRDAEVYATAPFAADMSELMGREIPAYAPLLRDERIDIVWTVGGQVGRISNWTAFKHSATPEHFAEVEKMPARERNALLQDMVGNGEDTVSPYMPSPLAFPRNEGTITVANSVGFAGIEEVEPTRFKELVSLLRGQDLISVRDDETAKFLAERDIRHRVVPDVVHAISVLRPHRRDPEARTTVVQVSSADLHKRGHDKLAEAILGCDELRGRPIRFVPAGLATGHDSVDDYERVIKHLREAEPDIDAEIVPERDPYAIVDHIRSARIVIATSLHMRIVASSYAVPRVGLARLKAARYARKWDSGMPYNVQFRELGKAVDYALEAARDPRHAERAAELARLAYDNVAELSARVLHMARTQPEAARVRRAEHRRKVRTATMEAPAEPMRRPRRRRVLPRRAHRLMKELRRRGRTLWWNRTHLTLAARSVRIDRENRRSGWDGKVR